MASTKGYMEYISGQLDRLDGVRWRAMMGEYILYVRGKVVGGIYDDRLLVKPTPAVRALMPAAPYEQPYPGAKEMLLVENVDDPDFLKTLLSAAADDLSAPKRK